MENWVRIGSFDRIHQAELRQEILKNHDINSVIIRQKDSALLIGENDLFVERENAEKAEIIVKEFEGWTRINSFMLAEQVERIKGLLDANGIQTLYLKKRNQETLEYYFELYVTNEDIIRAASVIDDILKEMEKIDSVTKEIQAVYRVEILNFFDIHPIILKKRNSEYHVEEISIYVEKELAVNAKQYLQELKGWVKINSLKAQKAELNSDYLQRKDIKVIEIDNQSQDELHNIDLFVEEQNEKEAIQHINSRTNWVKILSFEMEYQAEMRKDLLEANGVATMIVVKKDSAFLLGEVELYVEEDNVPKAFELIKNFVDVNTEESEDEILEGV